MGIKTTIRPSGPLARLQFHRNSWNGRWKEKRSFEGTKVVDRYSGRGESSRENDARFVWKPRMEYSELVCLRMT